LAQGTLPIEATPAPTPAYPAGHRAWGICWLMFAATALCYMDRQSIAQVSVKIQAEFGLTNEGFGWVLASFSMIYALFQVPAGFLADAGDLRRTYALAVAWWSLAGIATAFSPSLGALMALRALLGVGESFNWPCATRVTAAVLPPADRGLGNGIFNSGAAVGAVLSPLIVTPLTAWLGWRAAFALVGALGFVWVGVWLAVLGGGRMPAGLGRVARPRSAARLSSPARSALLGLGVAAVLVAATAVRYGLPALWWGITLAMVGLLAVARVLPFHREAAGWARDLGAVVRLRRFWVMVVVGISINLSWHFLVNWLPRFLQDDRKMAFLKGGMFAALPFLAADAGNLLGGGATRSLSRRGIAPARARLRVMAVGAALATCGAWVWIARDNTVVLILLAVMALGTAAFMANYFAACQDVSPAHTGLVVGLLGGLGNLFAAGFQPIAGRVKDATGGFGPVFVVAGLLPLLGLATLAIGWGRSPADEPAAA